MDAIRNLIFEGGGVKGIAYIGALQALPQHGVKLDKITRVGGASVGAITALLLGLNYSLPQMANILWRMDFRKVDDKSFGFIRNAWRLLTRYGISPGDYIERWLADLIATQTGSPNTTFAEIAAQAKKKKFRNMYFIATNLSKSYSEIFSFETTPGMRLVDAVRASMSIPLFFTAVRMLLTEKGKYILSDKGDIYVDGGVLNNYPIRLFDKEKYLENKKMGKPLAIYAKHADCEPACDITERYVFNKETLGFRIEDKDKIGLLRNHQLPMADVYQISGLPSYFDALLKTLIDSQQDSTHITSEDWCRTIYINSMGIKATDFSISDQQKEKLVLAGKAGVEDYIKSVPPDVFQYA